MHMHIHMYIAGFSPTQSIRAGVWELDSLFNYYIKSSVLL